MRRLKFKINGRKIGEKQPVFVVAEISANHGQSFNRAVSMIEKAKKCGADAVKFQAYTPDTLTLDVDNRYFRVKHPQWGGQTLYQLYEKAYTPWRWFKKLKRIADDLGMIFFSTAFDETGIDLLEEIDVPVHKTASFELVDLPLIRYMAKTKKPLILSTGMATILEIKEAINAAKEAGASDIILLKCVSVYPARPEDMHLKTIVYMQKLFNCLVGLSDHTIFNESSIAAVCLGAVMIEKHFTLSRGIKTPDSFFSLEPDEFKDLVRSVRTVEKALGRISFASVPAEKESKMFRRSLFVVEDVKKGELFTRQNIRSIRPGHGLAPKYYDKLLGKKSVTDIKAGTPLKWDLVK